MFSEIKNSHGEKLDFTFHRGSDGGRLLVVIGHGVTGNKDRPFVVALAESLAKSGISALRFSFSGNGGSGGRFVDSTITKEAADLGAVLDVVAADDREICFVGHSMGGAVGVIRASEDARLNRLISLAGMVDTAGFARREFGDVEPDKGNMWDNPECPLSKAFMDDLADIGSVADRGAKITVPWLLVHGTDDDVVPIQDSKDILAKAGANAELIQISGSDHVFSGDACRHMISAVTGWLKPVGQA